MDLHPLVFIKGVFSDGGEPSSSRVLMAFHAVMGAVWVSYQLYHGHPLADVPWAGLSTFIGLPYALNAAKTTITSFAGPKA